MVVFSRGHATLELAVSVGRSVGRSVCRSVTSRHVTFLFSAPAHPSATGGGVYTALLSFALYSGTFQLYLNAAIFFEASLKIVWVNHIKFNEMVKWSFLIHKFVSW